MGDLSERSMFLFSQSLQPTDLYVRRAKRPSARRCPPGYLDWLPLSVITAKLLKAAMKHHEMTTRLSAAEFSTKYAAMLRERFLPRV